MFFFTDHSSAGTVQSRTAKVGPAGIFKSCDGTVSVILSNPPHKDGNDKFKTLPLKHLLSQ